VLAAERAPPRLFDENDGMALLGDFKELLRNNSASGKPTTFDDVL
jgi:hypothetical protein